MYQHWPPGGAKTHVLLPRHDTNKEDEEAAQGTIAGLQQQPQPPPSSPPAAAVAALLLFAASAMAAVRSLRVSVKSDSGSDRSESDSDSESDRDDAREAEPMEVEEGELEAEDISVNRSLKELLPVSVGTEAWSWREGGLRSLLPPQELLVSLAIKARFAACQVLIDDVFL